MSYTEEMFGFSGTTVVVTGGAGVLPKAMAEALLRAGATVALWGRGTNHPVEDAAAELVSRTGAEGRVFPVTVDTAQEDAVQEAIAHTEAQAGVPTVLVNGVGGNKGKGSFVDIDIETFEEVLRLNLLAGMVIPTKLFARYWIDKECSGSIINIASMASYLPVSGVWSYSAAKSGVMNLTAGAAKELAPYGIRVNGIAPGFFISYQNKALLVANEETGELTDRGKQVIENTPYRRFGRYEELAGATLFLAAEKASGFVTGTTIPVDGGFLTQKL